MAVTIVDDITTPRLRIGYFSMFVGGTITASSEDTANSGEKENVADYLPYSRWKTTGDGTQWVQSVYGSSQTITYGAIYGHNLGTIGATVKFQYSSTSGVSWTDLTDWIAPTSDNEVIYKIWEAVSSAYVRVLLSVPTGQTAQIGVVNMGWDMVSERGLAPGSDVPFHNRDTVLINNRTQGGQQLPRSIVRQGYSFDIKIQDLSYTWHKDNWRPFEDHAELYGFFYMPLPIADPGQVLWCEVDRSMPKSTMNGTMLVGVSVGIRGRYRS